MFQLIYVSQKADSYKSDDTNQILVASRQNNTDQGITGFIIELPDSFVQILEGEEQDVRETFERISGDPRHRDIRIAITRTSDQREFGPWTMGFNDDLDPDQIEDARFLLADIARAETLTPQHGESIYMLLKGLIRD